MAEDPTTHVQAAGGGAPDLDAAIVGYRQLLAGKPDDVELLRGLAAACVRWGRRADALAA